MDWLLYVLAAGAVLFIVLPLACERFSPLIALGALMLVGAVLTLV